MVVEVIPEREDESTCDSCFLIRHRSRLAREEGRRRHCTGCPA